MISESPQPQVGIAVIVIKDGKILLGKRTGGYSHGTYGFTGGKLDYMELFEDCAKRETMEEAGIEIKNIRFSFVTNLLAYAPKHFVHLGFVADWKSGEPRVCEPEKFESWGWYDLDHLPTPLFLGCKESIECYKNSVQYLPQIR